MVASPKFSVIVVGMCLVAKHLQDMAKACHTKISPPKIGLAGLLLAAKIGPLLPK